MGSLTPVLPSIAEQALFEIVFSVFFFKVEQYIPVAGALIEAGRMRIFPAGLMK